MASATNLFISLETFRARFRPFYQRLIDVAKELINDYSYSTVLGMLKTLFSVTMLFGANQLSKKVRGESIV